MTSITVKSGTNALHGELHEFLKNTKLDATEWGLNLDLKLRPPTFHLWYVGTGLNLLHASAVGAGGTTKAHLNLIAGWEGRAGPIRPYAEAREILGNGSAFQVVGGLSFPLH